MTLPRVAELTDSWDASPPLHNLVHRLVSYFVGDVSSGKSKHGNNLESFGGMEGMLQGKPEWLKAVEAAEAQAAKT